MNGGMKTLVASAAVLLIAMMGCSDDADTKTNKDSSVSDLITADTSISDTTGPKPDWPFTNCPHPKGKVTCSTGTGNNQTYAEQDKPPLRWQDGKCENLKMWTSKISPSLPDVDFTFRRKSCTKSTGDPL